MVLSGVQDLIVVQANGRILVMPTERAASMKQLLDALAPRDSRHRLVTALYLLEPERPAPHGRRSPGVRPIAELRAGHLADSRAVGGGASGATRPPSWAPRRRVQRGGRAAGAAARCRSRARPSSARRGSPRPARRSHPTAPSPPPDPRRAPRSAGWFPPASAGPGRTRRARAWRSTACCSAAPTICSPRWSGFSRPTAPTSGGAESTAFPRAALILGDPDRRRLPGRHGRARCGVRRAAAARW